MKRFACMRRPGTKPNKPAVGALVWFARIIEWEFPNFHVKDCLENLYHAQEILERNGVIEGKIHRFLLVAQKPEKVPD